MYMILDRKKTLNIRASLFKTKQNKSTLLKANPATHDCLLSRQPSLRCVYYIYAYYIEFEFEFVNGGRVLSAKDNNGSKS